ncbi:MAG: hypothetical protein GF400_04920 [Candidatus Eisenbacteria bacterium]|nr:hypothetical protein [Candidatus Eisenbacteria bacterium]
MTRALLVAVSVMAVAVFGCAGEAEETSARTDSPGGEGAARTTESPTASDAARARGLASQDDEPEEKPVITLEGISYEWRQVPDTGIHVTLEFGNQNEVFERARAYVFVTARYSGREASSIRAFPWDTELVDGEPADYSEGRHIIYRKDYTVDCFVPYEDREGYFDRLRVMVYSEEGDLLINQEHELEVTGQPTGKVKVKPTLAL